MRVEGRQVVFQQRGRVALGIDGDEQRGGPIGVRSQGAENFRDVEHRRRADVRAVRVAEEYQMRLALEVGVGDRLAVLIDKLERTADRGRAGPAGTELAGGIEDDAEKQQQAAEKGGHHQQDMGGAAGHRSAVPVRSRRPSRRAGSRRTPRFRNRPTASGCPPASRRRRARRSPAPATGRPQWWPLATWISLLAACSIHIRPRPRRGNIGPPPAGNPPHPWRELTISAIGKAIAADGARAMVLSDLPYFSRCMADGCGFRSVDSPRQSRDDYLMRLTSLPLRGGNAMRTTLAFALAVSMTAMGASAFAQDNKTLAAAPPAAAAPAPAAPPAPAAAKCENPNAL